jgi:hypothetical protein
MVYFQTKNPNLGKFWRVLQSTILALEWKRFGIFYGHLEYTVPFGIFTYGHLAIGDIFHRFGTLCPEKAGNPAS